VGASTCFIGAFSLVFKLGANDRKINFSTIQTLDLSLNDKTALNIISKRVSDKQYFKEISHDNTGETSLISSVDLAYKNKENNLSASIFAESAQLVGHNNDAEYTRAPVLSCEISLKYCLSDTRLLMIFNAVLSFKDKSNFESTYQRFCLLILSLLR
jgi:hypothetical protein